MKNATFLGQFREILRAEIRCAVKIENFLKGRKMKTTKMLVILVLTMCPVVWSGQATSPGSIVGWGANTYGQAIPPEGSDFVAIAAGEYHSLALKSDGSIVSWGSNDHGAATPPLGSDFVAIAGGGYHSLAIKAADKDWIVSGDNMYSIASGNVGLGTTSPAEKLEVSGNVKISGSGNGLIFPDGTKLESQPVGDGGPDDDWTVSGDNMYSIASGNVGLGTTSPAEKLEVTGNVKISGLGNGLIFPDGTKLESQPVGDGGPDDDWTVSGDNMYSIPSGNVGIGTDSPSEKLDVAGAANLNRDIPTGIALRVNGAEALWYNGTYFSWGFGGTANFFADNVGIGTASPGEKLEVQGINPRILIVATSSNPELNLRAPGKITWAIYQDASTGDLRLYQAGDKITFQNSSGNVGVGRVDPGPHKLYVNGTGYATGGFWASDLRFKKNIKTIDSPMDKINNIRGVSFEWKRSEYQDKGLPEGEHYGVIAQEIEQVLPEIVKEGPDGDKAVSYTELVPILTEAIKEQQKQLEEQQRQVEYLLQRVEWLERIVQQQQFAKKVQQ